MSSDKTVGLVAARLLAISPTGDGHLITRGSRNLAFPDELSTPLPIEPGTPISVRFPLMTTSVVLPAGWRLRLALSGADFPVVWPPGEAFTLSLDPSASRLRLPTVPVRGDESRFRSRSQSLSRNLPASRTRIGGATVERDGSTTTYVRHRYAKEIQPQRAHLTYVSDERWAVSVGDADPASNGQSRGGVDHGTT